jgi:hypothetical protein
MLSVLLNHSPLYPFKQGLSLSLSLKLVLPDSAALPNQQPPGILVSTSPALGCSHWARAYKASTPSTELSPQLLILLFDTESHTTADAGFELPTVLLLQSSE